MLFRSFVLPAKAKAGVNDPEVILYRVPGVTDDGSAPDNFGVATVFHCTSFSGVNEILRVVIRDTGTTLRSNVNIVMPHLSTGTLATHKTALFDNELTLITGIIKQGTAAIAATSTSIVCTAMIVDAASTTPVGIALRMIRFNPAPGSQE